MDNNENETKNGSKIERLTKTNGVKSFVIILFVLELEQLNRELDNENTFFYCKQQSQGISNAWSLISKTDSGTPNNNFLKNFQI